MMKTKVYTETLEYREGDILGVEDYNGTLDRCDYGYIITVRYRHKDATYPTVSHITVYTIYSEDPIYDFRDIFDFIRTWNYDILNWEIKGIGRA